MYTDFDLEKEKMLRRRKVAEAILAQSQQPFGGTEYAAGGQAVRRSPLEGIAKIAQAYMGTRGQEKADEEAKALGQRQKDDVASAIEEYQRLTTARAAEPGGLTEDVSGNAYQADARPAFSPSPENRRSAAMGLMGKIGDPRDAAKMMVAEAMKTPEIKAYKPGDVLYQGGSKVGEIPKPKEDFTLGNTRYGGPDNKPLVTAPEKEPETVRAAKAALQAAGIAEGSPQWQRAMQNLAMKQTTHQPASSASATIVQEKEEHKTVGKGFGDQYIDLQKSGLAANQKIANLDRMQGLLEGVNTGKLTPAGTELAAYAKSLGFNMDPNLGNKQAADALSKEMALQLRNPSGGAGMPGALSDQDRKYLEAMVAGLGKDPQANKLIIDGMRSLSKRDQEVAQIARDYRQKKGQLDEGFYNELKTWSDKNQLFRRKSGTSGALKRNADGTYTYTPGAK